MRAAWIGDLARAGCMLAGGVAAVHFADDDFEPRAIATRAVAGVAFGYFVGGYFQRLFLGATPPPSTPIPTGTP